MEHFLLTENGTLKQWEADGTPLLFEEQWVQCNGEEEKKRRGGAPVCCPQFGELPDLKSDHDVSMPRHRLVRLDNNHGAVERGVMETPLQKGPRVEWYHATFMEPWEHTVKMYVEQPNQEQLIHEFTIVLDEYFSSGYPFVPVSIGLHPYFRTYGKPFMIEHGNVQLRSSTTDFNNPVVILWKYSQPLFIRLGHGLIEISPKGGYYTHFCVWSDCAAQYICVSPFLGYRYPYMLRSGEDVTGKCTMRFERSVLYKTA